MEKKIKIVTAAIIRKNGLVLVARRGPGEKLAGFWEFPGGKLEAGETMQECLARELKEELGLVVKVGRRIAESDYVYEHGSIRLVAFLVDTFVGAPVLSVHDRIDWVHPSGLVQLQLAPADVPIANLLAQTNCPTN